MVTTWGAKKCKAKGPKSVWQKKIWNTLRYKYRIVNKIVVKISCIVFKVRDSEVGLAFHTLLRSR